MSDTAWIDVCESYNHHEACVPLCPHDKKTHRAVTELEGLR
jgi:hypothetical protein